MKLHRKKGEKLIKKQDQVLAQYGLSRDNFDTYSFLPQYLEGLLRKHSVPRSIRSKEIDFRGDSAFLDFWKCLKGYAWFDVFFSQPIGNPILYSTGSQYPVATWMKHSNGHVILLPNTEFDTSDDYPVFVKAAKKILPSFENLTHRLVDIPWDDGQISPPSWYVDPSRLDELKAITVAQFDLSKLIKLCEELNSCYANDCFYAVTMLVRTIVNHVPPILGQSTFNEVANSYGGKSFKKSMQNLNNSLKNIADANLHLTIRNTEVLPNRVQTNFSHDLDVLLSEIIRVLKSLNELKS